MKYVHCHKCEYKCIFTVCSYSYLFLQLYVYRRIIDFIAIGCHTYTCS